MLVFSAGVVESKCLSFSYIESSPLHHSAQIIVPCPMATTAGQTALSLTLLSGTTRNLGLGPKVQEPGDASVWGWHRAPPPDGTEPQQLANSIVKGVLPHSAAFFLVFPEILPGEAAGTPRGFKDGCHCLLVASRWSLLVHGGCSEFLVAFGWLLLIVGLVCIGMECFLPMVTSSAWNQDRGCQAGSILGLQPKLHSVPG